MSRTYSSKLSELRITQAYVKLLSLPRNEQGARTISLARIGSHEVFMLDISADGAADASLFWLELFDHEAKSCVDSCNCTEIAQAVTVFDDFISMAKSHISTAPECCCSLPSPTPDV
jgi:hypothetical protein